MNIKEMGKAHVGGPFLLGVIELSFCRPFGALSLVCITTHG